MSFIILSDVARFGSWFKRRPIPGHIVCNIVALSSLVAVIIGIICPGIIGLTAFLESWSKGGKSCSEFFFKCRWKVYGRKLVILEG